MCQNKWQDPLSPNPEDIGLRALYFDSVCFTDL